jgi:hypothetical protein
MCVAALGKLLAVLTKVPVLGLLAVDTTLDRLPEEFV